MLQHACYHHTHFPHSLEAGSQDEENEKNEDSPDDVSDESGGAKKANFSGNSQTVIVDRSTPILQSVRVNGCLRFGEAPQGAKLTMNVGKVLVAGRMEIGQPEAPYEGKAEVVLHGLDGEFPSEDPPTAHRPRGSYRTPAGCGVVGTGGHTEPITP